MARTTKEYEKAGTMKRLLALAVVTMAFAPSFADMAATAAAGIDLSAAYCESTGQQYIDTGILGNPGLRVEAEIMWTDPSPTNDQHVIGSYDKNGPIRCYPISAAQGLASLNSFSTYTLGPWYTYAKGIRYRVVTDLGASEQTFRVCDMTGANLHSRTVNMNYASIASGQTLYLFALGHNGRANGVAAWTRTCTSTATRRSTSRPARS